MEKLAQNFHEVDIPTFYPKISKRGARIFWFLLENSPIVEKGFFYRLYANDKKYQKKLDEKISEMERIKEELTSGKGGARRRRLARIDKYFKKFGNMRRGNDKRWVALFSEKTINSSDKRAKILHPGSRFFFAKFCDYYVELVKKKDALVSPDLRQSAHFLNRYYGPEFWIMFVKGILKLQADDPELLQLIRYKYKIENPYELYVKLVEELFYEGLRIMLHKNDRREYFRENNTQWSRFSYEVAYCHWPVYFAMVGKSPMEKLIVGNATELMSKYERRLFNWKKKREELFPKKLSRSPPPSKSSPVSSRAEPPFFS